MALVADTYDSMPGATAPTPDALIGVGGLQLLLDKDVQDIVLPEADLIDKIMAQRHLKSYIDLIWHVVEPKHPLIWNWHLDAICDHLEAVTAGQIQYLLMCVPPRHTKSLTTSVFWPSWEWGPRNLPAMRYVCSSYAQGLSTRDALKTRRIIQSPTYQRHWGDRFVITSDQNQKTRYDNNKTGYRIATSVGGIGTGEGGDRILVDDAHNIKEAESDLIREGTITWWDESMSSRINNEATGAFVIIMQRSHYADLAGHVIEKDKEGEIELVKLILPARYEKDRELSLQTKTPLAFKDSRTKEGECLDKTRYPDENLVKLEGRMSSYAIAGQLQQRPSPRGGGLFKTENMVVVDKVSRPTVSTIRYWDKAGTAADQGAVAYTAGVKMAELDNGDCIVLDVVRGQWDAGPRNKAIKQTARLDGIETVIWIEQEPGSGGKESAQISLRDLAGFNVNIDRVTGEKVHRADAYATAVENGFILVLRADWTKAFIREHEKAPTGITKDQWDSAGGAYNKLKLGERGGVW